MKKRKLQEMTLREKIGQTAVFRHMLLDEFDDINEVEEYFSNNPYGATWPMNHPKEVYRAFEKSLGNPDLKGRKDDMYINHINILNKYMTVPTIAAVDAAGGLAKGNIDGHGELPSFSSLGAANDPDLAYRYGKAIGEDIHSIGFSWLWSPVVDNGGKFIDSRTLSADVNRNKEMLAAFIKGVQSAGVATCAKHFPGADPFEYRDPHFCTSCYSPSYEEWERTQMQEFQACIDAGVDSIMVGHSTFKAVDDTVVNGNVLPCTLSYKVITELIKGKMGFEGVVFTDDTDMKGLTAIYPYKKLCVELLRAGVDMILGPVSLDYIDIVEEAVLNGDLPESRIDDACNRVLKLKEKYGIFDREEIPHPTEEERQRILDNMSNVAKDVAKKGMTLVRNNLSLIPVKKEDIKNVKVVYIGYSDRCEENLKYLKEEFIRHGANCDVQVGFSEEDNLTLKDYDLIVYATYIGFHAPAGGPFFFGDKCFMMRLIMTECTEKSIGVSFGSPDIFFNYFTAANTYSNCYSVNKETMEAFVKALYGEVSFTDYNPFPLNPITYTNDVY